MCRNIVRKIIFVPVFPKLDPIRYNIVPKVQEHVSFWLDLLPKNLAPPPLTETAPDKEVELTF